MYTYLIKGIVTYNDAETESGYESIEINEEIDVDELGAQNALNLFLKENEQYDFYGLLTSCDAETRGNKGASFCDQNEDQSIEVELVNK